jgi:hypothetical protein
MSALTRGKFSAILAAMFVAGAAVGCLATVYYFQSKSPIRRPGPSGISEGGRGPTNFTAVVARRFSERLDLSEAQRRELTPVFEELSRESSLIFSNSFFLMDAALLKANDSIRPVLSGEEQLAKFEELVRDRRSFMEPWRGRGGRPGGRNEPRGERDGERPPEIRHGDAPRKDESEKRPEGR